MEIQDIETVRFWTETVRRLWNENKLFVDKGSHGPKITSEFKWNTGARLVFEFWKDSLNGHIGLSGRSDTFYKNLLEVEAFLELVGDVPASGNIQPGDKKA